MIALLRHSRVNEGDGCRRTRKRPVGEICLPLAKGNAQQGRPDDVIFREQDRCGNQQSQVVPKLWCFSALASTFGPSLPLTTTPTPYSTLSSSWGFQNYINTICNISLTSSNLCMSSECYRCPLTCSISEYLRIHIAFLPCSWISSYKN